MFLAFFLRTFVFSQDYDSGFDTGDPPPWESVPLRDAVVVGSGPAGATAALYLARAGYKPVVFHGRTAGGQLTMTTDVENFPTFKGTGPELVKAIEAQAREAGAVFVEDTVTSANLTLFPKRIQTERGARYCAKAVIIATGADAKYLGLPNETRLKNRGVSACATCDGPLFAGKDVVVVGGGDSAATEALTLSRICRTVTLLHRGESMSASAPMKAKLRESSVRILGHAEVIDVLGEEFVTGVKVRRQTTNDTFILVASAMFVAIGRKPATDVFKHEVQVDKHGYFIPIGRTTRTNVPGVFVAGDCADHVYRQAITSAGSGCQAALDAEHFIIAG